VEQWTGNRFCLLVSKVAIRMGETAPDMRHVFDTSARLCAPMGTLRVMVEMKAETRVDQ